MNRYVASFTFAAVLAIGMPIGIAQAQQPRSHQVYGTGMAEEDGIVFTTTLFVNQAATGETTGSVVVKLDLRAVGVPDIVTFVMDVTCVTIDRKSAWVGSIVTLTSNAEIVPVGATAVTFIRDIGGPNKDIMHGEIFDANTTCADRPTLPQTVVTEGNYRIR